MAATVTPTAIWSAGSIDGATGASDGGCGFCSRRDASDQVKITPPDVLDGVKQKPFDGASVVYTFDNPTTLTRHTTQYFGMVGNRARLRPTFHRHQHWHKAIVDE